MNLLPKACPALASYIDKCVTEEHYGLISITYDNLVQSSIPNEQHIRP